MLKPISVATELTFKFTNNKKSTIILYDFP